MVKAQDNPLVYIVVLNWNGLEDTRECLDSLAALEYPAYRVVVVDNGSEDGSLESLRRSHKQVEYIANQSNLGYARGNNVGIDHALAGKADYVLVLNNDTLVSPGFLGWLVQAAEANQQIGVVGPKIYYRGEGDKLWFAGGRVHMALGNTTHIGNRRRDGPAYEGTLEVDYVTGCAMLIKRSVLESIGSFDPAYVAYFEDCDLCLRAKDRGFRVVCAREAKIWHKVSASTGGADSAEKAYLKIVSGARFFRRHAPRPYRYTTIPLFGMAYYGLFALGRAVRGDAAYLAAVAKGFHEVIQGTEE